MPLMIQRGELTIEAAAILEPDGRCTVTAEVFRGGHMVRAFYRTRVIPVGGFIQAESDAIREAARLTNPGQFPEWFGDPSAHENGLR